MASVVDFVVLQCWVCFCLRSHNCICANDSSSSGVMVWNASISIACRSTGCSYQNHPPPCFFQNMPISSLCWAMLFR